MWKTMHVVVTLTFQTFSFRGVTLQQISSNFTIDGTTKPQYYQSFLASGSGFDASKWNPGYKVFLFPSVSLSADRWSGSVFYFAIYNKVTHMYVCMYVYITHEFAGWLNVHIHYNFTCMYVCMYECMYECVCMSNVYVSIRLYLSRR
jgi:hypothetical protein